MLILLVTVILVSFFFLQSSAVNTECKLYKLRIYSVHLNQFTDLSSVIYLVI